MKLPKSVRIKETISLFMDKYQYKVVLVSPAASWFRGGDIEEVRKSVASASSSNVLWVRKLVPAEIKKALGIATVIEKMTDYTIRVESPYINFYTNSSKDVETLANLDDQQVKYITMPSKNNPALCSGQIIVKNLDYDFKVTMGRTRKDYSTFVAWCENNDKIRITSKCKRDLSRSSSWGGGYFYVKGEKTLTMVRMFLGSEIGKIESVIKA